MMNLVDHLGELRRRIIVSSAAVLLAGFFCYFFSDEILRFLTWPIRWEVQKLFFFSPQGAFLIQVKTALFSGFLVASPVVLSQLWLFLSPGLYPREKRILIPLIVSTSAFFLLGAAFAFFLVMPMAMGFLMAFETDFLSPLVSISDYLGFLISLTVAFGLAFNLPVVVLAFVRIGLVRVGALKTLRPHAVVVIFLVAAILTPPDVVSQCLLAIPLLLLYELSIWTGALVEKKVKRSTSDSG